MTEKSPLEDPRYASFAWGRYKRLMAWLFGLALLITAAALAFFYFQHGFISIHFYIATAGAILATIMLTGSLMGLVFLSSGTGHDESVDDRINEGENH